MFKLFTRCPICKKFSFITRKCVVKLPTGHTATLQKKLMCGKCITKTRKVLENHYEANKL